MYFDSVVKSRSHPLSFVPFLFNASFRYITINQRSIVDIINIFRCLLDSGATCTKNVMLFGIGSDTTATSEFEVRIASTRAIVLCIKCLEGKKLVNFPWGELELGLKLGVIVETNSIIC